MNCMEFRRRRLAGQRADPGELSLHLGGCPECTRFSRSVESLDGKIETAVRIDPPGQLVERILLDQRLRTRRRFLRYAMAASATGLAVGVGYVYRPRRTATTASIAIDHVQHEPEALDGTASIPLGQVVEAFASRGGRLNGPLGQVTFLMLCPVPRGTAPHIVAATAHGQAHLLLLPYPPTGREALTRDGLFAVSMRAGRGSMAIVAGSEATVAGVERMIAQLVTWS